MTLLRGFSSLEVVLVDCQRGFGQLLLTYSPHIVSLNVTSFSRICTDEQEELRTEFVTVASVVVRGDLVLE